MRVAVLDSRDPFGAATGGRAGRRLCHALREHGHQAIVVELPFRAVPAAQIVDQMLAMRLVHLDRVDRTVGLRFPAYLVPHDDMALWALADGSAALRGAGPTRGVRGSVLAAERALARTARRLYAPGAAAAQRLARRLGVAVAVLHPPPLHPGRFRCEGYGEGLVVFAATGSRQRHAAALAAIGAAAPALRIALVELGGDAPTEAERARLLADARAAVVLGGTPDGGATIEAFHARKSVVALLDGERSELGAVAPALLRDGVNGQIVGSVEALAAAVAELAEDAGLAERRGAAGLAALGPAGVDWSAVVAELTR
jgi:hypothetical protein